MIEERGTAAEPSAGRVSRSSLLAALLVERFGTLDQLEAERPPTQRRPSRRHERSTCDDLPGSR